MGELEANLKALIVDACMLEDVTPEEIDSTAPLFGDGLGLDSVDALELAMAVDRRYGVRIDADDEEQRAALRSVETLARYVEAHRSDH